MPSKYWNPETGEEESVERKRRRPKKTALMAAVDILARQEQSEKKLREKLERKEYEDEEIDAAIERLKEKHYLCDADACARQFEFLYNESRSSVRQICMKLMQRGFPRDLVQSCVPRDTYEREKAAALRVLEIQYKPDKDPKKLLASLYRKGFDSSAIRAAVEEYTSGTEQDME